MPPGTPVATPVLYGQGLTLRPANDSDVPPLLEMFSEDAVERWWFPQSPDKVRDRIHRTDQFGWVIESEGTVRGWIQAGEEDDEEYRSAWMDIATATETHGTGLARGALVTVMRYLVEVRGHHRITIDPDVLNGRAVRAYEKVGFRTVGIMRHYCRRPDGQLADGMLMEYVVGIDDA